jgi:hypothetical protein
MSRPFHISWLHHLNNKKKKKRERERPLKRSQLSAKQYCQCGLVTLCASNNDSLSLLENLQGPNDNCTTCYSRGPYQVHGSRVCYSLTAYTCNFVENMSHLSVVVTFSDILLQ